MLIISRKKHETIKIGDDVEIVVSRIKGSSVRLGVIAPGDVRVTRGELPPLAATAPPLRRLTTEKINREVAGQ